MSRVGKLPIQMPDNVTISIDGRLVRVKGAKGELSREFPRGLEILEVEKSLVIKAKSKNKALNALHGTFRSHLANMVKGVSDGWEKKLELVGAGYRAEVSGKILKLSIGFSHPVTFDAPEGISFAVEKSIITIAGIDKELVGHYADIIRAVRPPEPYKGKGIKYIDEYVRRKAGKAAKTAA